MQGSKVCNSINSIHVRHFSKCGGVPAKCPRLQMEFDMGLEIALHRVDLVVTCKMSVPLSHPDHCKGGRALPCPRLRQFLYHYSLNLHIYDRNLVDRTTVLCHVTQMCPIGQLNGLNS